MGCLGIFPIPNFSSPAGLTCYILFSYLLTEYFCQNNRKRWGRSTRDHVTAEMWSCEIAFLVSKRAPWKWTGNRGSFCSCSAAWWLMHKEVGCIHQEIQELGCQWGSCSRLSSGLALADCCLFCTWCWRIEGWKQPTRYRGLQSATFFQEGFIPLLHLLLQKLLASMVVTGQLHSIGGKGTAILSWSVISTFLTDWGKQSFCLISSLSLWGLACMMQRHRAVVKIMCW